MLKGGWRAWETLVLDRKSDDVMCSNAMSPPRRGRKKKEKKKKTSPQEAPETSKQRSKDKEACRRVRHKEGRYKVQAIRFQGRLVFVSYITRGTKIVNRWIILHSKKDPPLVQPSPVQSVPPFLLPPIANTPRPER